MFLGVDLAGLAADEAVEVGALQSLAGGVNEVALRALDLEDLGERERTGTKNAGKNERDTLAPLAASPAGTVTLGSGLAAIANAEHKCCYSTCCPLKLKNSGAERLRHSLPGGRRAPAAKWDA